MTGISANFKFKSYIFNTHLNGFALALYESDHEYKVVVEQNGEASPGYATICKQKQAWGDDGVTQYMTDNFVQNEDDMHYNQARAVSNVLECLRKMDALDMHHNATNRRDT